MTKDEYEKLLKSDYWKGYSYSLIKERNFTCEDCGRHFPNERNKLQVHHLVYRDTNPWSYKPEELIVLCEDCHKRRHGIISEQNGEYESECPNSQNTREWVKSPERRFKKSYLAYILLILFFIWIGLGHSYKNETKEKIDNVQNVNKDIVKDYDINSIIRSSSEISSQKKDKQIIQDKESDNDANGDENSFHNPIESSGEYQDNKASHYSGKIAPKSKSYILDENTHASVVKQAKQAGVSSEGSTSEILDRITHASVVKQAKQIGVSTEGSTSEILDRITRKQMEKYNQ